MNVAVDVDGVLAEQVPPVLESVREKYGVQMVKEDVRTWAEDIPDSDSNIKVEIETRLEQPEFVRSMPPVEGAVDAMRRLASDGHRLVVATARDEVATEATKEWLDRHGFPFDEIRHVENGEKQTLDADVLIDDYPRNLTSFTESGGVGILFEQPWNSDFEHPGDETGEFHVAAGWEDVYSIVSDLASRVDGRRSGAP